MLFLWVAGNARAASSAEAAPASSPPSPPHAQACASTSTSDKPGLTFRYLDGREEYCVRGRDTVLGRWRPETPVNPTFYQVPYRCLVPRGSANVLAAGRLIDSDRGAYGAIRVMVNCNQTGHAAGLAASLAVKHGQPVADVSPSSLRADLASQGAVVL